MDYSKFTDEELKHKKSNLRKMLILSFVFIALGAITFYLYLIEKVPNFGIIIGLICFLCSGITTFASAFKITPIDKELHRRSLNQNKKKIASIVPANCKTMVTLLDNSARDINMHGYGLKKGQSYHIWKNNSDLNFFPTYANVPDPKSLLKTIPLEDILFYEEIGEVYHETKISGGGGRNISVTGAVIGNAVAGPAGAILLGNKGPKDISSHDVTHDTRAVSMKLPNQIVLTFSRSDFNTFMLIIPEKATTTITQVKESKNTSISSADEIIKFKKLLDDGIITQEEFDSKKKQLLNL